uniref:Beta-glucosidase I n=1 Tax=Rhizopus reflexus TaxID=219329 RepID=K9JYY3_9FUNG|nr:beta-glucosidase I [Rhizopus reflexus]
MCPEDYQWGSAKAAYYDIEGRVDQRGRGHSIVDTFCGQPGKYADASSGWTALDAYNRQAGDIALLRSLGRKSIRFSNSSRIPEGGAGDAVNRAGIDHYLKKSVDDSLSAGYTPFSTLFHVDLLHDAYGALLNAHEFRLDFRNHARVMSRASPKLRNWNGPLFSAYPAYGSASFRPGRTSTSEGPWTCGHNILVAHGRRVKGYRDDSKPRSGDAQYGIRLNGDFHYPVDAADRADKERLEFFTRWFADPIYLGDYRAAMRKDLGDELPHFTPGEAALVGLNDSYGMTHYTSSYICHRSIPALADDHVGTVDWLFTTKQGTCIAPEDQLPLPVLRPLAAAFRSFLVVTSEYASRHYYWTRNGTSIEGESQLPTEIKYLEAEVKIYNELIRAVVTAVGLDEVNVEFEFGYQYVDLEIGQRRSPRKSTKSLRPSFSELIEAA